MEFLETRVITPPPSPPPKPPPPKQEPRKNYRQTYDVLGSLIRARTSKATKTDLNFLKHVEGCKENAKKPCKMEQCRVGKDMLRHFAKCSSESCIYCVGARVYISDAPFVDELFQVRHEFQESVRKLKKCIDEQGPKEDALRVAYQGAKKKFQRFCMKVYQFWRTEPEPCVVDNWNIDYIMDELFDWSTLGVGARKVPSTAVGDIPRQTISEYLEVAWEELITEILDSVRVTSGRPIEPKDIIPFIPHDLLDGQGREAMAQRWNGVPGTQKCLENFEHN